MSTRIVAMSAVAAAFFAVGTVVSASPSLAAPTVHPDAACWSVFNGVTVDGGEASWSISCNNGTDARITGWVRDTEADGKCAHIKAFADNGLSRVPWLPPAGRAPQ